MVVRYFTLDGRFSIIYGYHFMLLNHFRHNRAISFPYYLLLSLENGIQDHRKNPNNPYLYEGLMLLLVDHIKANFFIPLRLLRGIMMIHPRWKWGKFSE